MADEKRSVGDIVFVTLVSGIFKFSYLTQESLHAEADKTIFYARMDPIEHVLRYPEIEPHPPLHHWVVRVSGEVFGNSHFGVRVPSALAATFTALVVYLIGRELFTRRAGIIAALITAVVPLFVIYGQAARNYALFGSLSALSLYFLVSIYANGFTTQRGVGFVVATVLMGYTHTLAALLIFSEAVIVAGLALRGYLKADAIRAFATTFIAVGVLLLPWAITIFWRLQLGLSAGGHNPSPTFKSLILTGFGYFGTGLFPGTDLIRISFMSFLAVAILPTVVNIADLPEIRPTESIDSVWVVAVWGLLPVFLAFAISLFGKNITALRFFIGPAIGIYLLVGAGVAAINRPTVRYTAVGVIMLFLVVSSSIFLVGLIRPDWQGGTAYIESNAQEGDMVISGSVDDAYLGSGHVTYYSERDDLIIRGVHRPPHESHIRQYSANQDRVWVIGHSGRVDAAIEVLNETHRPIDHRTFESQRHVIHVYLFNETR